MLRSLKEIEGYEIEALDGRIGKVKSCLFDDRHWRLRYLVADTGKWLPKKKVLISPLHLQSPELGWAHDRFPVSLTKESIENCPELDADAPVSRRYEKELAAHYNHAAYWTGPYAWGATALPPYGGLDEVAANPEKQKEMNEHLEEIEKCHLRDTHETMGYAIDANDGEFGHIDDFILNDEHWALQYAVVATRKWLPGKRFLVDIDWLESFDWGTHTAKASISREQIEKGPEFDPKEPINRDYLDNLYDYYGKPYHQRETDFMIR